MKIRKLTIRNIASIESAELDFEHGPLGAAPLFLICGETGSGKTTLLDCITLALYGKTPRYADGKRKNDCQIGGFAYNDARQLVRRGAKIADTKADGLTLAEASVELTGNDGRSYRATWSVDVFTRKPHKGELKKEAWCWQDCSANGLTYMLDKEIQPVIARAIGLDFDQFCRTVVLAQGQFTNFLLGTDDEKAAILEKLTNTEKFKRIGIAVSEKWSQVSDAVVRIDDQIKLLSDGEAGVNRPAVEARVEELKTLIKNVGKALGSLSARKLWLENGKRLAAETVDVEKNLETAFADLKAAIAVKGTALKTAGDKVSAIEAFLRENAVKAPMLEAEEVILNELGHVREARRLKEDAAKRRKKLEGSLSSLEEAKELKAKALKTAKDKADAAEAKLDFDERQVKALGLGKLRKALQSEMKTRGDIEQLGVRIETLESLRKEKATAEGKLETKTGELADREAELPRAQKAYAEAEAARDAAQEKWEGEKRLLNNGIEAIVAELKVGGKCPVCGGKIVHLNGSKYFAELTASLKGDYDKAEVARRKAEKALNELKFGVQGVRNVIESLKSDISEKAKEIKSKMGDIRSISETLGVKDLTKAGIQAAVNARVAVIDDLQEKVDAGEKREGDLENARKAVKKLCAAQSVAKDAFETAKLAHDNCIRDIAEAISAIESETAREEASLKSVSKKVVAGWLETWTDDADAAEDRLRRESRDYRNRKQLLQAAREDVKDCKVEIDNLERARQRALEKMPVLAEHLEAGDSDKGAATTVDTLLGQLASVRLGMEKHVAGRPQDLVETDTVEGLSDALVKCQSERDDALNEKGEKEEWLSRETEKAAKLASLQQERTKAQAEKDEWKAINDFFGDKDGKKVQREIQSYVLTNVLAKANFYLKQLSDRYVLSCEGLTLSVFDSFEGDVVRPVKTLSGGEQFFVSLALALGLAGMSETGLGVDMLLVDEGFGTLSGEHLNAAIEALERLNALTGSQKVGVISHVERLRERIPTHVEVTRNGQEPSRVKVVENGGSSRQ